MWEDVYRHCLEDMGFRSGVASPYFFYNPERDLACVVHGDDVMRLGTDADLNLYEARMSERFEIKVRGRLEGAAKGQMSELERMEADLEECEAQDLLCDARRQKQLKAIEKKRELEEKLAAIAAKKKKAKKKAKKAAKAAA